MTDRSTKPKRVQMSRQKPWRAEHPDAVIVDRRTGWGNWYRVTRDTSRTVDRGWWVGMSSDPKIAGPYEHKAKAIGKAVDWFRADCQDVLRAETDGAFYDAFAELRGRDLACWCPLDQPCHADVLLELANGGLS